MKDSNILNLSIDSSVFDAMREDFDKVLKRTIGNMEVKDSDEATLTLKLSIMLKATDVPDYESADPGAMRTIHKPKFDHKVSSVMQIKTEESGKFSGEYELVWDDELQDFVMKPIENGQMSFDDYGVSEDAPDEDDQIRALPPADGDYEDDADDMFPEDDYDYEEPDDTEE